VTYSDTLLDHACNPRNVGHIENADGIGTAGDPSCGDFALMTVRVRDGCVLDARFLVRGCGVAIATCSMATVLVKGKTLMQSARLTDEDVAAALGGLPEKKSHCSSLAATALHNALIDYCERDRLDLQDWRSLYRPT
jgi:nitrogen fixation NifU-like protein